MGAEREKRMSGWFSSSGDQEKNTKVTFIIVVIYFVEKYQLAWKVIWGEFDATQSQLAKWSWSLESMVFANDLRYKYDEGESGILIGWDWADRKQKRILWYTCEKYVEMSSLTTKCMLNWKPTIRRDPNFKQNKPIFRISPEKPCLFKHAIFHLWTIWYFEVIFGTVLARMGFMPSPSPPPNSSFASLFIL